MIFTVITGIAVGVFYAQATVFLQGLFERANIALNEGQMNMVSFALCLAAAAAVLSLIGVHSFPVLLCLGAAVGIARKPLLARITSNNS